MSRRQTSGSAATAEPDPLKTSVSDRAAHWGIGERRSIMSTFIGDSRAIGPNRRDAPGTRVNHERTERRRP